MRFRFAGGSLFCRAVSIFRLKPVFPSGYCVTSLPAVAIARHEAVHPVWLGASGLLFPVRRFSFILEPDAGGPQRSPQKTAPGDDGGFFPMTGYRQRRRGLYIGSST